MRERVLMCKETGELFVRTNRIKECLLWFIVLQYKNYYIPNWYDDMYEDLGYL